MTLRYRLVPIFMLIAIFAISTRAQEQISAQVIGSPAYNQTDNSVTADIVVSGSSSFELTNLTAANFLIGEPASNITVTAEKRLPLTLAIIIDLSFGSDEDLIRDTLHAYFNHYYQAEDNVTLYVLDADRSYQPRLITVTSLAEANSAIDSLRQSQQFYFISTALRKVLDDLIARGYSPTQPRQVLYLGSLLNDPDEVTASLGFAREGIPFHVVQVHRRRPNLASQFRQLASNGGGLFSNNQAGTFVLNEENYQPVNTLKVVYDAIDNARLIYNLRFTTQNQTLAETQTVPITIRLNDTSQASLQLTYTRSFIPPTVSFALPSELTVTRIPSRDESGNIVFNSNSQKISVSINFPDGVQRTISSMRLEVIDTASGNILQSTLLSNPEKSFDGNYLLDWSLDNFTTPELTTNLTVRVTAFDELNLSGIIQQNGLITVASLPPLPTATIAPQPTSIPTIVPTAQAVPSNNTIPAQAIVANDSTNLLIFAILILTLVVVLLFFRVLRFWREGVTVVRYSDNGAIAGTSSAMEHPTPNNLEDMITPTPDQLDALENANKIIYARLVVIEGYEAIGKRIIDITQPEFLIGRDATKGCDLVINLPYISPRHCRIVIKPDQNNVRDLNSKNGTFINGERVPLDVDMPVPIGSEIAVTKSVILEIWDADTVIDTSRFDHDHDGDDDEDEHMHQAEFQPLPGLRYIPDDGDPIGDNYSPI